MKLQKETLKQIRQFAKEKVGGFGMWLELAEKTFYRGNEKIINHNLLTPHDKGTRDLYDFSDWQSCKKINFDLVNGFCWLDFHVHDSEELRDYVHALVDADGNLIKLWITWAKEDELQKLIA